MVELHITVSFDETDHSPGEWMGAVTIVMGLHSDWQ